jgi:phage terminase large subunit-like protein
MSPLPLRGRATGAKRFDAFCKQHIYVPKGKGALSRLKLRPWQLELVGSVLDAKPPPRMAGWMLPRGQGKTSLVAALGLYDMCLGEEGASVVVVATNEQQAGICFRTAVRMVELEPELESRIKVYQDRLELPSKGASFQVLPAKPSALEGLDPTLAILDEFGVIDRSVMEVVALATGKRERSLVLGIGTPGPNWSESVLADIREHALANPDDDSLVWREFSAAGFEDHPFDCDHCWKLANPALGDFLFESGIRSVLPPKTRESTFRRARLCQFVDELEESWLPPSAWNECAEPREIPDGAQVVLALDGSYSKDATALVVAEISDVPHLEVVGLWEPPLGRSDYRVPMLDVEQEIRDACERWDVQEIVADPWGWQRSLQILDDEGLPVAEFPQSASRMTPATSGLYDAVINGRVTHSGDKRLARHVNNATVKTDERGTRIYKKNKDPNRRIDLAVAAIMAHSRAVYHAGADSEPGVYWA